jgi:hypothetical protein
MGQEFGHAYEDLLELALQQILPEVSKKGIEYRISPERRMKGVSGNIDHLVEVHKGSKKWLPFVLFMEKHSDSANESEKHFRRHLEEYIQAKISSVQNFGFHASDTLKVVNLIYGTSSGWKNSVINESKRLLYPTLYLVDEPYYEDLNALVRKAILTSPRPYRREVIKQKLVRLLSNTKSFQLFLDKIYACIFNYDRPPKSQQRWVESEISRALLHSDDLPVLPAPTYARRSLTELFILPTHLRNEVVNHLRGKQRLDSKSGLTPEQFRLLQLGLAGSNVTRRIGGINTLIVSPLMRQLPITDWIERELPSVEQIFFGDENSCNMSSGDYLAYFDIRDKSFVQIAEESCHRTLDLLNSYPESLDKFLMNTPSPCEASVICIGRPQSRVQNVYLESTMALASLIGRRISETRFDLSTSTLARLSNVSEGVVNKARSGAISKNETAARLVKGVMRFYDELGQKDVIRQLLDGEIKAFKKWTSWVGDVPCPNIPNLINPEVVMSLAWFRHNQLNSHPIFNPVSAIIFEWARTIIPNNFTAYGFPVKRSENPLKLILGQDYEGADYEFTTLFWNKKDKALRVFESSSVINFKHTSDKSKELCAKIRAVKAVLSSRCDAHFWLLVDGDWTGEHVRDLLLAGWDTVLYSRDFLSD